MRINRVEVFSSSNPHERASLGDDVTDWLAANPQCKIVDRVVSQSSDQTHHCLSITLFLHEQGLR